MDFDLEVKLAIYHHFAETGAPPSADQIGEQVSAPRGDVLDAYRRLRTQRVLVLEADGASIRMAPPFSGVATQHVVTSGSLSYFANCAWDAFGIPAALHKPATVHSRCEQSMQPLQLEIESHGPPSSDWLFHCLVPAAHWWDDIVFT
jgi:Alkylmercury lyase